jgi:D-alanine-D-alanine ligase
MKNIAILMGGYSSEYQISINSGNVVYNNIKEVYNAYRVHISKQKWTCIDSLENEHTINKGDFTVTIDNKKVSFDCVYNTIHGTPGEDGHIQAYFSLLNIPQTSCEMYQAALTFNKRDLLSVLSPFRIPMATSFYYNEGDIIDTQKIISKVGLPCFVKANRAGSSYGVTKVYKKEEIPNAIENALKEDNQILIESFLDGIEVSVGVVTYKGATRVLPVTEIVSETDFFDFDAKYKGLSEEITPARISEKQKNEVSALAEKIYNILELQGLTRADFIFHNNTPHFIEVNTNPGLSEQSIIPQQAKAAGIDLKDLFSDVIDNAIDKKA